MELFDCHVHVEQGLDGYKIPLQGGNIIFNSVESYRTNAKSYPGFSHSLIFDFKANLDFVAETAKSGKLKALKIHSRIQRLADQDYEELVRSLKKLELQIPIIYDAFYYGSELEYQPSLQRLIQLAKTFPHSKFIVAHAGGTHVLEYFFHLRDLPNIGYDLSFSLQYLLETSVWLDLKKLIKHVDTERLFWGSDYPFAEPLVQVESLGKILDELRIPSAKAEAIYGTNWIDFVQ